MQRIPINSERLNPKTLSEVWTFLQSAEVDEESFYRCAQEYPVEAMRSPFYGMATLIAPERWLRMEQEYIGRWVPHALDRTTPFSLEAQVRADLIESVAIEGRVPMLLLDEVLATYRDPTKTQSWQSLKDRWYGRNISLRTQVFGKGILGPEDLPVQLEILAYQVHSVPLGFVRSLYDWVEKRSGFRIANQSLFTWWRLILPYLSQIPFPEVA